MSSHDDDDILDFDFFEDDATRETQGAERAVGAARPSGGGGGGAPAGHSSVRRTGSLRSSG